jgi:hypothetical protein
MSHEERILLGWLLLNVIHWGRALSPGVKQLGPEAWQSPPPPTNATVKETWIKTSTPSYIFVERCLIS